MHFVNWLSSSYTDRFWFNTKYKLRKHASKPVKPTLTLKSCVFWPRSTILQSKQRLFPSTVKKRPVFIMCWLRSLWGKNWICVYDLHERQSLKHCAVSCYLQAYWGRATVGRDTINSIFPCKTYVFDSFVNNYTSLLLSSGATAPNPSSPVGQGLLIHEISRSHHTTTHHNR